MDERRRGRLGFDLDGVLYPWHEIVVEFCIGQGLVNAGTTTGDFFKYPNGFMHTCSEKIHNMLLEAPEFYIRPFLRPGTREVLNTLKSAWEIFYVTSRRHQLDSPTKAWAKRMLFPYRDNVYVVDGGKKETVKSLDIDIFIEDRTKHVEELEDICAVILVTQPWNKDYNKDNHVRIDHLLELVPLLENGYDSRNNKTKDSIE